MEKKKQIIRQVGSLKELAEFILSDEFSPTARERETKYSIVLTESSTMCQASMLQICEAIGHLAIKLYDDEEEVSDMVFIRDLMVQAIELGLVFRIAEDMEATDNPDMIGAIIDMLDSRLDKDGVIESIKAENERRNSKTPYVTLRKN